MMSDSFVAEPELHEQVREKVKLASASTTSHGAGYIPGGIAQGLVAVALAVLAVAKALERFADIVERSDR